MRVVSVQLLIAKSAESGGNNFSKMIFSFWYFSQKVEENVSVDKVNNDSMWWKVLWNQIQP